MLGGETVFVIGAGASFELGLPLGTQLREQISEKVDIRYNLSRPISGDYQINEHLREIARENGDPSINGLLHKCWLMRDALPGAISIDNLIDAHRSDVEFAEIAKMAIAKSILQAERRSKLFVNRQNGDEFNLRQVDGTYLIPLLQLLTENVSAEGVENLFSDASFIIFNYDRCLEFFLPNALSAYYGLNLPDATAIVDRARIIHPYGTVGDLGQGTSLATAGFGAGETNIRHIAKGIRTFSEGLADDTIGENIRSLVGDADQVVFLGFAFHPMNMEIIDPKGSVLMQKLFGTTIGLSEAAIRSVERTLLQRFGKVAPTEVLLEENFGARLEELNLEARSATDFLQAHFRGIASS